MKTVVSTLVLPGRLHHISKGAPFLNITEKWILPLEKF